MAKGKLRWMRALVNYQAGWFYMHPGKISQQLCVGLVVDCLLSRQALITRDAKLFRWANDLFYAKILILMILCTCSYICLCRSLGESPEIKNIWISGDFFHWCEDRANWGLSRLGKPGEETITLHSVCGIIAIKILWQISAVLMCGTARITTIATSAR